MKSFHSLKVARIDRQTDDAVAIIFEVPESDKAVFNYKQGQHITIRREINGEELRRCYSICAGVQDETLRVAVKEIKDGRFSSFINRELKVGDVLDVYPPAGRFYTELNRENANHYLAFAGGSGITPVLSLIKTTLFTEPKSRFTLIFGNRDSASIIFAEELFGLKNTHMDRFQLFHVLENETQDIELFNGMLTPDKCKAFFNGAVDLKEVDEVFVCGPGPMMDSVESALIVANFDPAHIHIERFISGPDAGAVQAADRPSVNVTEGAKIELIINGVRSAFAFTGDQPTILDAALEKGTEVPYACKGAVCCTCRAKVLEGSVEMALNYGLEADEVAAGYVLTCQATPTSDRVVLSFDD